MAGESTGAGIQPEGASPAPLSNHGKAEPQGWRRENTMDADTFKALRLKLGLTQEQMALALMTTGRNVRFYEAGQRPIAGPIVVALRYFERYGLDRIAKRAAGV